MDDALAAFLIFSGICCFSLLVLAYVNFGSWLSRGVPDDLNAIAAMPDREKVKRRLQRSRVLATLLILPYFSVTLHHKLAIIYWAEGNLEAARDEYLKIFKWYRFFYNARGKADMHNNLAAVYSKMGDREKAQSEWRLAADCMRLSDTTAAAKCSEVDAMAYTRDKRHPEAYREFESTLLLLQSKNTRKLTDEVRVMFALADSAYESAMDDKALEWATIGRGLIRDHFADLRYHLWANTRAAKIASDTGHFAYASSYLLDAYNVALALEDETQITGALGRLAKALLEEGQIRECLNNCDKLERSESSSYYSLGMRASGASFLGQYQECYKLLQGALDVLAQEPGVSPPQLDMLHFYWAQTACVARDPEIAERHLDCLSRRSDTDTPDLQRTGIESWLLALQGERERSRSVSTQLAGLLIDRPWPWRQRTAAKFFLATASHDRAEFSGAVAHWNGYLAVLPAPVWQPYAHYQLAECHLQLGNREGAIAALRQAAAAQYPTHWSRQAERRLEELTSRGNYEPGV